MLHMPYLAVSAYHYRCDLLQSFFITHHEISPCLLAIKLGDNCLNSSTGYHNLNDEAFG